MAVTFSREPPRRGRSPWRRLTAFVVSAAMAAVTMLQPLVAYGQEAARHAVIVVDANTGRVLYQSAADERRHPASLTKLMTLYILFEMIEQGRLSLTSKIRFSANAVAAPPSRLEVEEGAEIELIDAIKVLIVKSANDVAIALAERVAGSEEGFADLMNRKARELGMNATEFHNASGLPDPEQVTTARDMITLALRLQDRFPKYYPLFSTRTFTWGGETYRNHNTLLFSYHGLDGMKTGYTRASGFNLVASARRGKKHLLVAYFGGTTAAMRNASVRAHLDAGFPKASEVKTRRPAPLSIAKAVTPPAKAPAANEAPPAPRIAVSTAPAPQLAQRAMADPSVEIVRVRPVRAAAASSPGEVEQAPPEAVAPVEPRHERPSSEPAAGPPGMFQVQVGAFQTPGEAERQFAFVRERTGGMLAAHGTQMTQVKLGAKTYFRARYVGFNARASAAGICDELKKLDIDCMVMRSE